MLKSFTVTNFLSINECTYSFDNSCENYINEEGLKAFFILKFLITLSEQKPELVTLINNEIRPNPLKPIIFSLNAFYNENNYEYLIEINQNCITSEVLKINNFLIFNRSISGIILNNEPITWNCPNQNHKVFLDACAVNDQANNNFLYSFKENILGLTKFCKNPLDDDINKLFSGEASSITSLIKNILIINEYYDFDDDINQLNNILLKNNFDISFKSLDLNLKNFLKLNINLTWLVMIGGGTLFLDHNYYIYQAYLNKYLENNQMIQIIFLND